MNIASRMESHGIPNRIQVSAATYELLKDTFQFEDRGCIAIKGRGQAQTYLWVPPVVNMGTGVEWNNGFPSERLKGVLWGSEA